MAAALRMAGRGGAGDDEGTAVRPRGSIAASLKITPKPPVAVSVVSAVIDIVVVFCRIGLVVLLTSLFLRNSSLYMILKLVLVVM